ncbi:unnamed protein product [Oikopleura dioica]|uniref:Uncharacterized protein n=1 Tax=Oikopleura dioica TaxID=34765 RepID=E4Z0H7_OIKDI|nr:unnamed protein product [Oikopleura dioica]
MTPKKRMISVAPNRT